MSRVPAGVGRSHAALLAELEACGRVAGEAVAFDARAPDTSGWSVGEHLEHLLLADRFMLGLLEGAAGGEPPVDAGPGRPTLPGYLVLWTGFIPRGAGKAPAGARPRGLSREEVLRGLAAERQRLAGLEPELPGIAAAAYTIPHPALGRLTPRRWLRFAAVHHAHHARIVRDILEEAEVDPPPGWR